MRKFSLLRLRKIFTNSQSQVTNTGAPQQAFTLLTLLQNALFFFFPLFFFRPTFIPFTNTYLIYVFFRTPAFCTFFYILLQIYSCLSYNTCIADCCLSPWRYNTKSEQQHRSLLKHPCMYPTGSLLSNRCPIMFHSVKACIFLLAFP